jgi:hypothetical protein
MNVLIYMTTLLKNKEVVSKPQIVFEGKAQAESKAQHIRQYVSILSRLATQPSDTRWGFESTSKGYERFCR